MHHRNGTPPPDAARYGIIIAGMLTMLIGAFWLGAWFTGYAARHSLAGFITVKTNMALGQLLGGMALLLLGVGRPTGARRWVGTLFASVVLLIGTLTLGEHLLGWNLGIDQLLAKEPAGSAATLSPNRIGYPGASSLALLGFGLLALVFKRRAIVPYIGLIVCVVNLVPAVGYLYGIGAFYHTTLTVIAWPTVIALMSLGIGLAFARTDGGPMALLLRDDAGGKLLRRMLPWVIFVPLLLGYLLVMREHRGLQDVATGTGSLVIALILVFALMLWRSARDLSRSDIAHRQDEEALRESEERYRTLFSSMSEGFGLHEMIYDDAGKPVNYRFLEINHGFEEQTGLKREDVIGKTVLEVLPDTEPYWIETYGKVASTGESARFESYHGLLDRWYGVYAFSPARGRFAVLFTDITARKKAEEALRESREDLERAQAVAHIGSWRMDVQRNVLEWSEENHRVFGVPEGTPMTYEMFLASVHPDDREYVDREWTVALRGEPYDIEHRIIVGDTVKWVRERAELEFDKNGELIGGFGTTEDITERKQAEELLRESEEHMLEFYRRTIDAATGGKLVIMEWAEMEKIAGPAVATWEIRGSQDLKTARHGVEEVARSVGISDRRLGELTVAVGEAVMNVVKHAGQGQASLHKTEDSLIVLISDHGPGISALALPDVALRPGYSTAGTLGMGYKLMIEFADKVRLATSDEGTAVALEVKIHPTESSQSERLIGSRITGGRL